MRLIHAENYSKLIAKGKLWLTFLMNGRQGINGIYTTIQARAGLISASDAVWPVCHDW